MNPVCVPVDHARVNQRTRMESTHTDMMEKISPIQIPKEVSPEFIAKVVFNVLYRKSLDVHDKWCRWLLLATLQILETNTAPYLDVDCLRKLQGLCKNNVNYSEKEVLKDDVAKENVVELKKSEVESKCPEKEVSKFDGELDIAATTKSPSEKRTLSEEHYKNKKLKITEEKGGALKNTDVIRDGVNDDSKPEIEKSSRPDTLFSSKESQVTPKMLRLVHNKWTQMWKKKTYNKISQTENEIEKDSSSGQSQIQDLSKNDIHVEKTYIHQEAQTVIRHYTDFSCQYSYKSKTEKKVPIPWKLIPLSGLAIREGKKLKSSSYLPKDKEGTESDEGTNNIELSNLCGQESQFKTGSESDGKSVETPENSLVDVKLRKSLFHGRLMITSKSKITPPNIPLVPIDSFLLSDPRNAEAD